MIENKHSFYARLSPIFSPKDLLDVKLAYSLAKFGHRAQTRKELVNGKPTRYFEHCRRATINLIDEMKICDKAMIIATILHDSIEDCEDLSPELLEHCFGTDVITIIKYLSKSPKEGYIERLNNCQDWRVIAIKVCDRLDNLRSLMVEGVSISFQKKQIKETQEKYYQIFDKLNILTPVNYMKNVLLVVDEIKNLINLYSEQIKEIEK